MKKNIAILFAFLLMVIGCSIAPIQASAQTNIDFTGDVPRNLPAASADSLTYVGSITMARLDSITAQITVSDTAHLELVAWVDGRYKDSDTATVIPVAGAGLGHTQTNVAIMIPYSWLNIMSAIKPYHNGAMAIDFYVRTHKANSKRYGTTPAKFHVNIKPHYNF